MTEEEMKAKLEEFSASIKALETKNKELLSEKQKAKQEADEAREAAEEAAAEKAREAKDVEAIEKRLNEKHAKELKKFQEQLAERDNQLSTLLIDNTIKDHLAKHNVAPQFHKAVTAMLKAEAKLEAGEAMVNGVALSEHVSSYFSSDEGRAFVAAPANSGAGAFGNKTTTPAAPDKWNLTTYVQMKGENPEGAKAYAAKHNKTF